MRFQGLLHKKEQAAGSRQQAAGAWREPRLVGVQRPIKVPCVSSPVLLLNIHHALMTQIGCATHHAREEAIF
jgi:hypothetical protein